MLPPAPSIKYNPPPFLLAIPKCTTVHSPHPSSPDEAAFLTITTKANCTHPSLPPYQSPTTYDPSPPNTDNEEVVILGFVSPAEATTTAVNTSTHASGKDTEVSNVIAFFNPQATSGKKPRCNTLHECFNITLNVSGGMMIACKNCTNFGVSNCF